jgi:hypothetical protein
VLDEVSGVGGFVGGVGTGLRLCAVEDAGPPSINKSAPMATSTRSLDWILLISDPPERERLLLVSINQKWPSHQKSFFAPTHRSSGTHSARGKNRFALSWTNVLRIAIFPKLLYKFSTNSLGLEEESLT